MIQHFIPAVYANKFQREQALVPEHFKDCLDTRRESLIEADITYLLGT